PHVRRDDAQWKVPVDAIEIGPLPAGHITGILSRAVHKGKTKIGWSHIYVGTRQDVVSLEQRALAERGCHHSSDQISFKDAVKRRLFRLGRYSIDTDCGIGSTLNRVAREIRIHHIRRSSDEVRPPISV